MATMVELLAKFRRDQDDNIEPYLWSDTEFEDYMDEAQDEFCELVDVIADDIEIAYVAATVAAADGYVALPEYVTRIRSAEVLSTREYLTLSNQEEMEENPDRFQENDYGRDRLSADWKDETATYPEVLITDMKSDYLRLYPIPTADDTISLRVYRRSTTTPNTTTPVNLEVTASQHQRAILLKARSIAYLKQDSETYDVNMSQKLDAEFMRRVNEFEKREKRRHRRSNLTSYGGIPQST